MKSPLSIAVVGLGRMGRIQARHVAEITAEAGACRLTAAVAPRPERAEEFLRQIERMQRTPVAVFPTVEELIAADAAEAAIVCSPTAMHRPQAEALAAAGVRILLEKPLTDSLTEDRTFAAWLDAEHPDAVMLALQRRFDPALRHVKKLLDEGAIGRPFRLASVLEDSGPPPSGYHSAGILLDMAVHNVDEVAWLTARAPEAALAIGSRLYGHRLSTAVEDFDDGFLYLWFPGELVAQVQVSRNHVPGYRNETAIFGETGAIHVGRFAQNAAEVVVEAFGRERLIERRTFPMGAYAGLQPEFVGRFGLAYKAEVAEFIERCASGAPFSVTHRDGLRAMEAIDAGMRAAVSREAAGRVPASREDR